MWAADEAGEAFSDGDASSRSRETPRVAANGGHRIAHRRHLGWFRKSGVFGWPQTRPFAAAAARGAVVRWTLGRERSESEQTPRGLICVCQ